MTPRKTSVDIVIPVYNEEQAVKKSVEKLLSFIKSSSFEDYDIKLKIVDNASVDKTGEISKKLVKKYKNTSFIKLSKKGRGRAIRKCWKQSEAEILVYMDVDLSADLRYLKPLIEAVSDKRFDIAIGSRLKKYSIVRGRTLTREMMSRVYNSLINLIFNTSIKDAQCGFKAIDKKSFTKLEPLIKNQNWFFDSEMLIIASKLKMKIEEIPISWTDDPTSTVKIAKTATEDLKGLWRLIRTKPWEKV